jgi:hypothetical protein
MRVTFIQNLLKELLSLTTCKCKSVQTLPKIQCFHGGYAKFGQCQSRGVRGIDCTNWVPYIQNILEKSQSSTICIVSFSKNVRTFPKCQVSNVPITSVQSLDNVSLEV